MGSATTSRRGTPSHPGAPGRRRRARRLGIFVASVAAFLAHPTAARANGRFPYANQLAIAPSDPNTIMVRTTFGLLLSKDRGASFTWICEQIIGFTNGSDPGVGVFQDGSIAVAGFFGLAISHDRACSFPFVGGGLDKQYAVDVAVDRGSPSRGVAVTATSDGGQSNIQVFETVDNGGGWASIGTRLDPALIATNVEVAASRASRIYVSGSYFDTMGRHGFVAASDDRGQTWTRTVVDNVTAVYLSAVDPQNADRVYARSFTPLKDELLVSDDGARTFRSVLKMEGGMLGLAISPDGAKIAVGGPTKGTFTAARDSLQFVPRSPAPVTCLTWDATGLYACGAPKVSPFIIARSSDEGQTWSPLLAHLTDILGPSPTCGATSPSATTCVPVWPVQQAVWSSQPDAAAPGTPADAGPAPPPPAPPPTDGGACELGRATSDGLALALAAGVLAALGLRRRRRA